MKYAIFPAIGILFSSLSQGATIQSDSALIPAGLGVGDSFQLIFITSTTTTRGTTGDDATFSFWDGYVNAAADANTFGGTGSQASIDLSSMSWKALVSTSEGNAVDHAPISGALYNMNLTLLATDSADFYDAAIAPGGNIRYTESGAYISSTGESNLGVWTGTNKTGTIGTYGGAGGLDLPFTDTVGRIYKGQADSTSSYVQNTTWWAAPNQNELARVYGVSEVITVVAVPEPASALLGGIGCLLLLRRRRRA